MEPSGHSFLQIYKINAPQTPNPNLFEGLLFPIGNLPCLAIEFQFEGSCRVQSPIRWMYASVKLLFQKQIIIVTNRLSRGSLDNVRRNSAQSVRVVFLRLFQGQYEKATL